MCEIKLRCWSPDNQEMYYPDENYSFRVHQNSITFQPHYESDDLDSFCTDPSDWEKKIQVMQWCGRNDRKNSNVYADDILISDDGDFMRVWFEDGNWLLGGLHKEWDEYLNSKTNIESLEIVGNIYKNPTMLD